MPDITTSTLIDDLMQTADASAARTVLELGDSAVRAVGATAGTVAAGDDARLNAAVGIKTATTTVAVSSATAPSSGQVLTATSPTAATWQTPSSGSGKEAQVIHTTDSTAKSSTATFPLDNTIPQSGEGSAYTELNTTITPTNASSVIHVRVNIPVSVNGAGLTPVVALFRDSATDASSGGWVSMAGTGYLGAITFEASFPATSTSATVFKIRYGLLTAGTVSLNTANGTAYLGGIIKSTMTVTEILP